MGMWWWRQSQEAAVDHSRVAIELLRVAHGLYTRLGPARPARLLYRIGGLMVHTVSRRQPANAASGSCRPGLKFVGIPL